MAGTTSKRKPASIRTIWGLAKSPELSMTEDDVHDLVYRETGKESLRKLTQGEINKVVRVLQNLKDGTQRPVTDKRTDDGGDPRTVNQRRKIYQLCEALGWNDDSRRINAFVKRMTGVDRLEWINPTQCEKVIEAFKAMASRKRKEQEEKEFGTHRVCSD